MLVDDAHARRDCRWRLVAISDSNTRRVLRIARRLLEEVPQEVRRRLRQLHQVPVRMSAEAVRLFKQFISLFRGTYLLQKQLV